ncbi:MAG: 4Fe-4S binding protein [Pseudomonadota bacterium]
MKNIISRRPFQRISQFIALFFINGHFNAFATLKIYQGRLKSVCVPVLNCHSCPLALYACPIGALQYFFMTGRLSAYVLGIIALVGVTAGRIGCGLLCPFGLLQDILFRLGSVRIPLPKGFTYIKYGILLGVVGAASYLLGVPAFCKICPVAVLEAGYPNLLLHTEISNRLFNPETQAFTGWFFLFKTLTLVLLVLMSTRIKRPFCRIFCPLGALFGLFNRFSVVHISVDKNSCNSCQRCARICPVDLDVYQNPDSPECILCMKCTSCNCISARFRPIPVKGKPHAQT